MKCEIYKGKVPLNKYDKRIETVTHLFCIFILMQLTKKEKYWTNKNNINF